MCTSTGCERLYSVSRRSAALKNGSGATVPCTWTSMCECTKGWQLYGCFAANTVSWSLLTNYDRKPSSLSTPRTRCAWFERACSLVITKIFDFRTTSSLASLAVAVLASSPEIADFWLAHESCALVNVRVRRESLALSVHQASRLIGHYRRCLSNVVSPVPTHHTRSR